MRVITVAEVTALYALQSQTIDDGDGPGWAATFTTDGVFHSPTYGDPVAGAKALEAFAAQVFADVSSSGERQRHWINSVVVDPEALTARAYLMIVRVDADGVPALMRHVVVEDQLALDGDGRIRVRHRTVRRDP